MSFLGKLFKKTVTQQQDKHITTKLELNIDNLVDWLKTSNSVKLEHLSHELEEMWRQITDSIASLQKSIKSLEKVKFEPNDKTYAAVNMSKDLFTKKSQFLNKVPKSIGSKFSDAETAYNVTLSLVSELKEANIKQAYIISNYFKKEADEMIRVLKQLDTLLANFDKKLKSDGEVLKLVEQISTKVQNHSNLRRKLACLQKDSEFVNQDIEKQKNILNSLNVDMEKIGSDKRWADLDIIKKEIFSLNSDLQKLKSSFNEDISSIRKPIKKILHDSQNLEISKEQRSVLSQEIEIEDVEVASSVLKTVDKILTEGTDLKSTELAKINSIRNKLVSGEYDKIKSQYKALLSEKQSKESEASSLSEIEKIKGKKELQIKENEEKIAKLKQEADGLEKEKSILKGQTDKELSEIRSLLLEKLNREVTFTEPPSPL